MTRQEFIERMLWLVDGCRFGYLTRAELINKMTELIDNHPEAL